jgi:C-8 sterol isomerase
MAPKIASSTNSSIRGSWTQTKIIVILILAASFLFTLFRFLDSHLEWFYIFTPSELHDLSVRAIGVHGNDTRSVVEFIVSELSQKHPGGYVNLDEEWIFNNAGGAMGAMYIIHASKL